GSPELDVHAKPSGVTPEEVKRYYDINFKEFGIAIFHPVTSEASHMGEQAQALFGALQQSRRQFVVIAPNNDPGADAIARVIDTLPAAQFRVIPSMRFAYFSELMRHAQVMIGNSSAGVREAPFFGLPSMDIGSRQHQRAPAIAGVGEHQRSHQRCGQGEHHRQGNAENAHHHGPTLGCCFLRRGGRPAR
ncbi:MAG: hypothetical protein EBY60_08505, partial [Actinobacteria bacterium]|nr:hypothetical protein [Actinomycetota bacterium]